MLRSWASTKKEWGSNDSPDILLLANQPCSEALFEQRPSLKVSPHEKCQRWCGSDRGASASMRPLANGSKLTGSSGLNAAMFRLTLPSDNEPNWIDCPG